jgi:hypothetical protein
MIIWYGKLKRGENPRVLIISTIPLEFNQKEVFTLKLSYLKKANKTSKSTDSFNRKEKTKRSKGK